MHRQSSIRNHRSKKIKVKHALQICFLLVVCFWLIYQVVLSHDKKREFDESDPEGSSRLIKVGRKDIHPRVEEIITKNERRDGEAEDEVVENKHEEERPDNEKVEENLDLEIDREADDLDDDENETEGNNPDGGKNNREAREELYKADDVSNAVTHDTRIEETTQIESEIVRNSIEQSGELAKDVDASNVTDGVVNSTTGETNESPLENSLNGSQAPNNTLIETSNGASKQVTTQNRELSLRNVNGSVSELNQEGQGIVVTSTSKEGFNSEEFSSSSNNTDSSASVEIITSDMIDGKDEILESPVTENLEEIQTDGVDLSDFSNSLEEKNAQTDLDTFPEMQTEGTNSEDIW